MVIERTSLKYQQQSKELPGGSDSRESACNGGDPGSIPESGRSLAGGNGYPLQYSCLENFMARGDWWATVHGVAKSRTPLSKELDNTFAFFRELQKSVPPQKQQITW